MSAIRTFVVPAFILLGLYLIWNNGTPSDFHGTLVPPGATALKPDASLPTFHSVQTELSRGSRNMPNEAVGDGVPPNNANENIFHRNRESVRQSTMRALEQAWSTFCTPAGRKKLAASLNYYFERRGNEEASYAKRWGQEGRDYITREWSTSDDRRIERLVSETYERGYIDLSSVRHSTVKRMVPLLKNVKVQGEPCKN
jgi:hypothetical protein